MGVAWPRSPTRHGADERDLVPVLYFGVDRHHLAVDRGEIRLRAQAHLGHNVTDRAAGDVQCGHTASVATQESDLHRHGCLRSVPGSAVALTKTKSKRISRTPSVRSSS